MHSCKVHMQPLIVKLIDAADSPVGELLKMY